MKCNSYNTVFCLRYCLGLNMTNFYIHVYVKLRMSFFPKFPDCSLKVLIKPIKHKNMSYSKSQLRASLALIKSHGAYHATCDINLGLKSCIVNSEPIYRKQCYF